jgi:2'-hydroxyisoflavone reductase
MLVRREFLEKSLLLAGGASLIGRAPAALGLPLAGRASRPLRILILGGTGFIGPHHVSYAVARGHQISVFNRGRNNAVLPSGVEQLSGDRNNDLSALKGREWDAAIDTAVYQPSWVRSLADVVAGNVGHYTFISSAAVYDASHPGILDESTPLRPYTGTADPFSNPPRDQVQYGPLKTIAIQEAQKRFRQMSAIHCGLIVGPRDGTDRWTYWIDRVSNGGEILAPGKPSDPMQWIDARDLAEFAIHGAERGLTGNFNAATPPMTFAEMLAGMSALFPESASRFTWVDQKWLQQRKITHAELPAWHTQGASNRMSGSRARANGMTHRSLRTTASDTYQWLKARPEGPKLKAGWSRERELATLGEWRAQQGSPTR